MTENFKPIVMGVDDDPLHNLIIESVLKSLGISPIITTSTGEFLNEIRKTQPALCLVDINIHTLGEGYELIKTIRSLYKETIPIIVISEKYSYSAIAHALEIGANDFLTKPIDREAFAWKLNRFLKTDELFYSSDRPFLPVPEGGTPAEVELEVQILEVDEFGILFASDHLPVKGSSASFQGPLISDITGSTEPQILTIISTSLLEGVRKYSYFAEFNSEDEALLRNVRKWIIAEQ